MKTLIADSGSTKTTWCLVEKVADEPAFIRPVQTQGLNPLYASADDIAAAARHVVEQTGERYPDLVQFYGAGCSADRVAQVEEALRRVFMPTTRIEVASDVVAACRALGDGICCILGTGAVAARFLADGTVQTAPSLGYILGDEGSGAWLGRQVLADYLKVQMPERTRRLFEEDFGVITAESAIGHVYQQPFPNRYLASFAVFIGRYIDQKYCEKLAYDGVEAFFRRNVMRLNPKPGETVSFVGSVAYHLQPVLAVVAAMHDLTIGQVLKEPMEGLVRDPLPASPRGGVCPE
ncbi:MAG: ATPase [Bacteroidales bacterium]|nr:ATPase [Bacteroidales bacterium]